VNGSWTGSTPDETYQNVQVTVANTGDTDIENWALSYDFGGEIQNIWNAVVGETDSFTYVQNNGQNYDIAPNGSFNFGYILKNAAIGYFPENIELCTSRTVVNEENYSASLNVTNDRGAGFSGEFVITNLSNVAILNPELSLKSNFEIVDAWSFDVTYSGDDAEGKSYKIKSKDNNRIIAPGGSIVLGFNGARLATLGESEAGYTLSAGEFGLTEITVADVNIPTPGGDGEVDYSTDTDEDGLPDFFEKEIGTDQNNPDTDGDGLPDGCEVLVLGTAPLLVDTDDNGTSDADEDFDEDGLSNLQEYLLETNPFNSDSDGDTLLGGEEVNVYGTNPLKVDTDDDGMSDPTEIFLGLNPLNPDSDGNGILDSEETIVQELLPSKYENLNISVTGVLPSITFVGSGDFNSKVEVVDVEDNKAISDLNYIIGHPFDIRHNEELSFESSTISFTITDELANLYGIADMGIAFYDYETGSVIPVETEITDDNVITATVEHYSTYFVYSYSLLLVF
jgi:hypothetical protein